MKLAPYVERLQNSKEYKQFQAKSPDSFMVAGFFILDLEAGKNVHQIDYYLPKEKKIAAFTLDKGVTMQMLNLMNTKVPEKLDLATQIDLDALKGILQDEMKNRSITEEVKKIIAILQTIDGKKIWNLNCVLSGMSILRAHVEDESKSVLKMEKASILDYVKKMPGMAGMPQQSQQTSLGAGSPIGTKEQLEKLNQLEAAIEKEKARLQAAEKEQKSKKK